MFLTPLIRTKLAVPLLETIRPKFSKKRSCHLQEAIKSPISVKDICATFFSAVIGIIRGLLTVKFVPIVKYRNLSTWQRWWMAHLVKWSIPIPEIRGSNPIISKFLSTNCTGRGGSASGRVTVLCPSGPGSNPVTKLSFFRIRLSLYSRWALGFSC